MARGSLIVFFILITLPYSSFADNKPSLGHTFDPCQAFAFFIQKQNGQEWKRTFKATFDHYQRKLESENDSSTAAYYGQIVDRLLDCYNKKITVLEPKNPHSKLDELVKRSAYEEAEQMLRAYPVPTAPYDPIFQTESRIVDKGAKITDMADDLSELPRIEELFASLKNIQLKRMSETDAELSELLTFLSVNYPESKFKSDRNYWKRVYHSVFQNRLQQGKSLSESMNEALSEVQIEARSAFNDFSVALSEVAKHNPSLSWIFNRKDFGRYLAEKLIFESEMRRISWEEMSESSALLLLHPETIFWQSWITELHNQDAKYLSDLRFAPSMRETNTNRFTSAEVYSQLGKTIAILEAFTAHKPGFLGNSGEIKSYGRLDFFRLSKIHTFSLKPYYQALIQGNVRDAKTVQEMVTILRTARRMKILPEYDEDFQFEQIDHVTESKNFELSAYAKLSGKDSYTIAAEVSAELAYLTKHNGGEAAQSLQHFDETVRLELSSVFQDLIESVRLDVQAQAHSDQAFTVEQAQSLASLFASAKLAHPELDLDSKNTLGSQLSAVKDLLPWSVKSAFDAEMKSQLSECSAILSALKTFRSYFSWD